MSLTSPKLAKFFRDCRVKRHEASRDVDAVPRHCQVLKFTPAFLPNGQLPGSEVTLNTFGYHLTEILAPIVMKYVELTPQHAFYFLSFLRSPSLCSLTFWPPICLQTDFSRKTSTHRRRRDDLSSITRSVDASHSTRVKATSSCRD